MKEITGPIVGVVLVMLAVFIPTTFISGISGQLYRQFALTIAASTVISGICSLTLSPALCGLLLKTPQKMNVPKKSTSTEDSNISIKSEETEISRSVGVWGSTIFNKAVSALLRHPRASAVSFVVLAVVEIGRAHV